MREFRSEAIVLQSIPFKERDRIVTLLTKEGGIVKLFVSGRKFFQNGLTERFTIGEYLFSEGKGELFRFVDGTVFDQNLGLRTSWEALVLGEKLCDTLLKSQFPEKESPELYILLCKFLQKIPTAPSLDTLWASYLIKMLKHEGLLQLDPHCTTCFEKVSHRYAGMRFCAVHAPAGSLSTTSLEEQTFTSLYEERSLDTLLQQKIDSSLLQKIETLFIQAFD